MAIIIIIISHLLLGQSLVHRCIDECDLSTGLLLMGSGELGQDALELFPTAVDLRPGLLALMLQ